MVEQPTLSQSELLSALRASEQEVVEKLSALPEAEFEQGRYENGWNGRQILAHIASIEWTYPRLIQLARQEPQPAGPGGDEREGAPARTAQTRGGIDAYNQRQVEQRAGASAPALLDEFRKNRAALIAAVEATDEAVFAIPIRSAGGVTGTLGAVLYNVAVRHVLGHAADIAGGTRPA